MTDNFDNDEYEEEYDYDEYEEEYDYDDEDDDPIPSNSELDDVAIRPESFKLQPKGSTTQVDLEDLEPGEKFYYGEEYNPFRYCYALLLEELNMEVMVKFEVDEYDRSNLMPVKVTGNDGVQYTVPFFPRLASGNEDYQINNIKFDEWRSDERKLNVVPTIVRAKVLGKNGKPDVLVDQQIVLDYVTPERLFTALLNFNYQIADDPAAPIALRELMSDIIGRSHSECY